MNKRFVILYWLLLLVPTSLISVALFQLLLQEQSRIVQATYSTAEDRARNIAETIRLTTRGVEHTIIQALFLIPKDRLKEQLQGFSLTTDLVSQSFIWSQEKGLVYPVPGESATSEEAKFIERYHKLFADRASWNAASSPSEGFLSSCEVDTEQVFPRQNGHTGTSRPDMTHEGQPLGAEALRAKVGLTNGSVRKESENRYRPTPQATTGGWIPWFVGDRLSLLCWTQRSPEDIIYGVELNLQGLLYWLVSYFPDSDSDSVAYALLDSRNHTLHQTGTTPIPAVMEPDLLVPLDPCLPQWKVAMYVVDAPLAAKSGKAFVILAGLLLAIFVVAIILGGAMLTWQAQRNMTYAQQKTTFVSNVSHELKTPLTSIRMFAELLKEERIKDPEKKSHYLQVIVAECQRLTRLVNNVLDFGRLEQGRKQYNFREIELSGFLRGILEIQRMRIQKAGVELQNEITAEERVVRTDPDALEQVLLNLLDNAIKYAAEGKELTVDLQEQGDDLKLMVMDRGPGVPAKHRERIFEKFHRIDDSLTSRQPGSGLGLSIARIMMREMKGDVYYEPRVGGGSCFSVLIPRDAAGNQEASRKGAATV